MLFNSYIFIFLFLPLALLGWYGLNRCRAYEMAKLFLAVMSLWFYGYFNLYYLFVILGSILVNYLLSFLLKKFSSPKVCRAGLWAGVLLNLGILFYFKYYDFFFENVNAVFKTDFTLRHILLPLGISFFTFQQLSFIIDRAKGKAEHYSFINYLTFVTFFPQLIAGPIVLYKEMMPQFEDTANRRFNSDQFAKGIIIFTIGLGKKVLLADNLALPVNFGFEQNLFLDTPSTLLMILAYTFQIYFDFSGYSDMALGLGMMFGFHFRENFNYPYVSGSIKEFWRRWHMSLSGWFKEYLYIPLGGNRKGKFRTVINKMIVFLCTGIWHGASFNFLFWGAYHGFFLMLEEYVPFIGKKGGKVKSVFQHIYALLTVCIGFVFFRADTMKQGCFWIREMFTDFSWKTSAMSLTLQQLTPVYFITLAAALVAAVPVNQVLKKYKWYNGFTYVLSLAGFCLCILSLAGGTYNPFIYFRF